MSSASISNRAPGSATSVPAANGCASVPLIVQRTTQPQSPEISSCSTKGRSGNWARRPAKASRIASRPADRLGGGVEVEDPVLGVVRGDPVGVVASQAAT